MSANSEIRITARFYNNGEKDIKLDHSDIIENSILFLRISDEKGNEIHPIPPSVPKDEKSSAITKILKPKENYIIKYDLNINNPVLSEGSYCVTMREGASNKVWFKIE